MAETVVKLSAIEAASETRVRVKLTRIRELRYRMRFAVWLLQLAQQIGCFTLEYVDQLPLPRHDRRRLRRARE